MVSAAACALGEAGTEPQVLGRSRAGVRGERSREAARGAREGGAVARRAARAAVGERAMARERAAGQHGREA